MPSLSEALSGAFEAAPEIEAPAVDSVAPDAESPSVELPSAAAPDATASDDRGDGRRPDGTFAPKQASTAQVPPSTETGIPPVPAAVEGRKAPSSWKKEMWDHYGKLSPEVQDYIDLRERQALEGIAPHKQAAEQFRAEAEQARELKTALQPFEQELAAHNMKASDWVRSLGQAQMVLVKGTPEQKMGMFQNLMQGAFGGAVRIATQDAQGNWQLANPVQQQPQQPQRLSPDDIKRIVREENEQAGLQTTLQSFLAEAPIKYPHYEEVKPTMIGLLQSGLAKDLPGAYQAALRMPAHEALYQTVQKQDREAEESRKALERANAARVARANNLSPRSTAPTTAGSGAKGLRGALEENFEAAAGRV